MSFSSDMMKVLSTLSKEDLSLIMLKYQENYNDDELAEYFHVSIDEIKEKDFISSYLKKLVEVVNTEEKVKKMSKKGTAN